MAVLIQQRRGTASQWTSTNPILAEGEIGYEYDTGKFKVGNGVGTWSALAYSSGPQGIQGIQGPAGTVPVFSRQNQLSLVTGGTRFYFENAGTITKIRASVGIAPTGAPVVIQTLINGSVIATTSIGAGSNTQLTTLSNSISSGDYATVNITGIGSTISGSDLTVTLTIT